MRRRLPGSLILAAALLLVPLNTALAHGEPTITVAPAVVAAGGEITITGSEMEANEVFALSLEGVTGSIELGEVSVTGEGEEAGFTATLTVPLATPPGAYLVAAAAEDGDTTTADLTVTAPAQAPAGESGAAREPTAELHALERPRPTGWLIVAVALAVLSGAAGLVLVRGQG